MIYIFLSFLISLNAMDKIQPFEVESLEEDFSLNLHRMKGVKPQQSLPSSSNQSRNPHIAFDEENKNQISNSQLSSIDIEQAILSESPVFLKASRLRKKKSSSMIRQTLLNERHTAYTPDRSMNPLAMYSIFDIREISCREHEVYMAFCVVPDCAPNNADGVNIFDFIDGDINLEIFKEYMNIIDGVLEDPEKYGINVIMAFVSQSNLQVFLAYHYPTKFSKYEQILSLLRTVRNSTSLHPTDFKLIKDFFFEKIENDAYLRYETEYKGPTQWSIYPKYNEKFNRKKFTRFFKDEKKLNFYERIGKFYLTNDRDVIDVIDDLTFKLSHSLELFHIAQSLHEFLQIFHYNADISEYLKNVPDEEVGEYQSTFDNINAVLAYIKRTPSYSISSLSDKEINVFFESPKHSYYDEIRRGVIVYFNNTRLDPFEHDILSGDTEKEKIGKILNKFDERVECLERDGEQKKDCPQKCILM